MRLKGRYVPDRKFCEEPKGVQETDIGNGMHELTHSEISVITFRPRVEAVKRKSPLRKMAIVASVFALPVLFVLFADILVEFPRAFWSALAVAAGWPAFVVWANMRDT